MPAIASIADLINAVVPDAPRGQFHETLQRRALPLSVLVFKKCRRDRDPSHTMEQRIRIKAASSARFVRPYEGFGAQVDTYLTKIACIWSLIVDKMPFNEVEDQINSGSTRTKIISLYDARRSAFYEGIWNLIETSLAREPNSSSELDKSLCGFPYWFRRLTGTADTRGGFNGQTIQYLDGTTSTIIGSGTTAGSTTGAVDSSLPGNAATRNWAVSYSGVFDLIAFKSLRRGIRRTQFMRLDALKGDLGQAGEQYCIMPEDQRDQYEDLVNTGPDDNDGDLTKHKKITLDGIVPLGVPELGTLSYAPIYWFKTGHLNGNILKGDFMKERSAILDPFDPLTAIVPITSKLQMEVTNIRNAGGVMSIL